MKALPAQTETPLSGTPVSDYLRGGLGAESVGALLVRLGGLLLEGDLGCEAARLDFDDETGEGLITIHLCI